MDDNIVPIMGILVIFGLPVAGWIIKMNLAHRERMAMIQAGMIPQAPFARRQMGPQAAPTPPWQAPPVEDEGACAQRSLQRGITLTAIGFALFIGLSFIGYSSSGGMFGGPRFEPGPWLLGGLIPMFVGIARIIIGLMSGARFGIARGTQQTPPPNAAATGTYNQYPPYARPVGPKVEELKRPGTPPAER